MYRRRSPPGFEPESTRTRSKSPRRSPTGHHHRHHRPRHHREPSKTGSVQSLPYNAPPVSKHDFQKYKPLFTLYLDVQKQLLLEELPEDEVRGRWKSFVGRWNRGELAAGWYEPSTLHKAQSAPTIDTSARASPAKQRGSPIYNSNPDEAKDEGQSDDDDLVGPTILGHEKPNRRAGPAVPNMQDLELQREMEADEQGEARQDLRYARKLDRKQQKERLEEIAPRAEAGTRERQLEKRREVNDKMRAFRDKSPGAVEEVRESDLLGDDGVDGFRAKKKEMERKKNERELRKEEVLRARAEEREERLQIHRAKEEKTVSMLKALAKQRYG